MGNEDGATGLIAKFIKEGHLPKKDLADKMHVRLETLDRWGEGKFKPTGTAEAILLTLIGLMSLPPTSSGMKRAMAEKPTTTRFDNVEIVRMPGFLPEYRFRGTVVVPKSPTKSKRVVKTPGSTFTPENSLSHQDVASILADVFQPAGIPFAEAAGSLASGLAIYRLLRRWIAGETLEDENVKALEDMLRSLIERERQARRIEVLERRLKAEQEKMGAMLETDDPVSKE